MMADAPTSDKLNYSGSIAAHLVSILYIQRVHVLCHAAAAMHALDMQMPAMMRLKKFLVTQSVRIAQFVSKVPAIACKDLDSSDLFDHLPGVSLQIFRDIARNGLRVTKPEPQ